MKTIIVPTDFSEGANQALQYAVNFARHLNQPVHLALLHVLSTPVYATDLPLEYAWEQMELMKKESEIRLKQLCGKHAHAGPNLRFSWHVRTGLLLSETEALQAEAQADMVIMGTQGETSTLGKFFGSNAHRLASDFERDVLVVPPDTEFRPYRTIIFAADLAHENVVELRRTVQLAAAFDARVIVAHVEDVDSDIRTRAVDKLWHDIKQATDYPKVDFVKVFDQNIEQGLEYVIGQEQADLLVMSPRSQTFWEMLFHKSHTKSMILQPHIATLCIRPR